MNSKMSLAVGLVVLPLATQALTIQFSGLNLLVPDGDSSGLANQQTFNLGTVGTLLDVNVWLNLSGVGGAGFNGDLYAWLQHDTGFSVLLNRAGRDVGSPGGYADNGYSIGLDDTAPNDIHTYRASLSGPFPLSSALTGSWQPDGREIDPANVVTGDPRTALLDSFHGLDPNGTWTLFIADLADGGQVRLDSWALELTTTAGAVPDSGTSGALLVTALGALALARHYLSRRQPRC